MKAYILSIVGVVLLTAIVGMIAPSGKMGNFIKGTVKLVGVFVLVSPFVTLLSGKGEVFGDKAAYETDETYLERSADLMAEADGREIAAYLREKYSLTAEVSVIREIPSFFVKSIAVKISDFGINGDGEHIDIVTRVKSDLKARYGCEAEIA